MWTPWREVGLGKFYHIPEAMWSFLPSASLGPKQLFHSKIYNSLSLFFYYLDSGFTRNHCLKKVPKNLFFFKNAIMLITMGWQSTIQGLQGKLSRNQKCLPQEEIAFLASGLLPVHYKPDELPHNYEILFCEKETFIN